MADERRKSDMQDAFRYAWEAISPTAPAPQWVIQPFDKIGWQLVQTAHTRERGPRYEFTVRMTTGQPISHEELQEMLETIRDMFQETFAASVDAVVGQPESAPYVRPPRFVGPDDARRPW